MTLIPAPEQWIPFQADVLITIPGKATASGRYVRRADGSTRLDTGPTPDRLLVTSISNVAHRLRYVQRPRGWSSVPWDDITAEGWHPGLFRFAENMPGLRKLPGRVYVANDNQLLSAEVNPPAATERAFEAYQYVNPQGNIHILVPELNFFPILRQDIQTGRREGYSQIRLAPESPDSAFQPPAGVVIVPEPPVPHQHPAPMPPGAGH